MEGKRIVTPYRHWYNGKHSNNIVNYHFFHAAKQFHCGECEYLIYERPHVQVLEQDDGTFAFIPDWSKIVLRDVITIRKSTRMRSLIERGVPFEEGTLYVAKRYQNPCSSECVSMADQRQQTFVPWRAPDDPLHFKIGEQLRCVVHKYDDDSFLEDDYAPPSVTVVSMLDPIAAVVQDENGKAYFAQLYDSYDDHNIKDVAHWSLCDANRRLEKFRISSL